MESKLWNYSLMFLAVGFFAYAGLRLVKPRSQSIQSLGLIADYSMPRPDSYSGDFSIKDREVNRRYERNKAEVMAAEPIGVSAVKELSAEEKKATEAKKEKAAADKKKLADAETAKKLKKYSVESVNTAFFTQDVSVESISGPDSGVESYNDSYYGNTGQDQEANNRTPTSPKEDAAEQREDESTEQLSAQDWIRQIRSNPNAETVAALVTALQSSKISEKEYNQISRELIQDQDPRLQEVSLILIDSNPGVESLKILVEAESSLTGDLLAKEKAIIQKYGSITRSLALAQTMVIPELTDRTLALAELAIKNEQARRSTVDPRTQRGQGRTPAQNTHFQTLAIGLTTVIGAGSNYAARAQELMRAISELQKS